eukprot:m.208712 g.208712  ORF g.208712 m.208712 type:complete len:384 (+) comp18540_c0_seq2:201-1352(+)
MANDFMARLRRFDAYPKTMEDFRVKTFSGAAVTVVAGVLMVWLFLAELSYYMTVEVQPELFVDTSRNQRMRINLDVDFPYMPCSYLSIDVMDVSGEQQMDVHHNLFKQRLDKFGNPVEEKTKEELARAKPGTNATLNLDPNRCESCYGAETPELKCCNSCADVQEAYRKKGWALSSTKNIEQCDREGVTDALEAQKDEGCSMHGYLMVNKVAGNFHFAPGRSFSQHNIHVHDLQSLGGRKFNITHRFKHLSFGDEYPGLVNPLDNHEEVADGQSMYQYFVKVVPTRYRKLYGNLVETNQYSVTRHVRGVDASKGEHGLPGVFVMIEISPIVVHLTEQQRSFMHFLTSVCAIIGGIFTVAGMIDGAIYHGERVLREKNELGKLG